MDTGDRPKARSDDVYLARPATAAPVVLAVVFVALSVASSPWWLAGVPFAALGTLCAQPNLNLVNGFPAYVAAALGIVLGEAYRPLEPLGLAILAGSWSGICLGAVEKRLRATKYQPDSATSDQRP